jgi:hypothetical protein
MIFLPEEIEFLKYTDECVIDYILGVYEPLIKKLNRETLLKDIGRFYYNPLDEGVGTEWSISDGFTPHCIESICKNMISVITHTISKTKCL